MESPRLLGLDLAADPDAWTNLGFAVDEHGVCRVDGVALRLGQPGPRISGWALSGAPEGIDVDGLPTTAAPAPVPVSPIAPTHLNGTVAIDHVVVVSPDPERTIAALAEHGVVPRQRRRTNQYGPLFTQTFFRLGDPILELIGPDDPAGAEPARFYGIAFTVRDLDATAAVLGSRLGTVKAAVQPGRRIATLRREAGAGVPLAFMSPEAQ
ncbi:MAG TPA: VOC family protein [Acidimicrobiia bacterium]|nr:VOC family protein [Acidimicrobiia bacterium]